MAYYKNVGFVVYLPLTSQADTKLFKANPTIAAGDALLTVDGGATGNLGTLPTVTPASGSQVKFTVSAAENSGDYGEVLMIDAAGAEWCSTSFSWQNVRTTLASGTAQAGAASTITLLSGASATNDLYKHGIIEIIAGTGALQTRQITGYVGSTKVATVGAAWATNPDNTSVYLIHPAAGLVDALATAAALATVQADADDIQTRIPAALVSGRIDASVGAMAAGVVTAAAVATGAIDADALAADAVDEIWDEIFEGTLTARQGLRLFLAVLAGISTGGGTVTINFRDNANALNRVQATVDASGNRSAVALNVT